MATMEHIVLLAFITVLAVLFTLRRVMSWRVVFGYALFVDITFTVVMLLAFKGTVSGAASATLAGLMLGVTLTIGKMLVGHERLSLRRCGLLRWRWHRTRYPSKLPDLHILRGGLRAWAENQMRKANERANT